MVWAIALAFSQDQSQIHRIPDSPRSDVADSQSRNTIIDMKVAIVTSYLERFGGAESMLARLGSQAPSGVDVQVYCTRPSSHGELLQFGDRVTSDVIVSWGEGAYEVCKEAALISRISPPLLVQHHRPSIQIGDSDAICFSRRIADAQLNLTSGKVEHVWPSVNEHRTYSGDRKYMFGTLARMQRWKGHSHVLRAMHLHRELSNQGYLAAGPRQRSELDYPERVMDLAKSLKIEPYAWQDGMEPTDFFSAVRCLVLLSEMEPYGLSALEAAVIGIPVLVSADSGSCTDPALEGVVTLVPSRDPSVVAEYMRSFASNLEYLASQSQQAAQTVAAKNRQRSHDLWTTMIALSKG